MRKDAIELEEGRVGKVKELKDYTSVHERHRIFPAVFENREHKSIIDMASGVGVVGKRINDLYADTRLICNDISPTCLKLLEDMGLKTTSFDIDDDGSDFPFDDNEFDAVIALATIEHVIHIDHFVEQIRRMIREGGYFYCSAPNYSGILYLLPFLLTGKTFHDPLDSKEKYEFYAHVRYFTYRSLVEYVSSFGFTPVSAYLPLPSKSSSYTQLKLKSKSKAFVFRNAMRIIYHLFGPRWASEPIICFQKQNGTVKNKKIKKIVL